jgi:ABC-type branched-subunit amino acid transport system substrate-binding protein
MFSRTIPSDAGNAIPVIRYIREVFGVKYLAVINVNDAYGNAFVQGLRKGAELHAPDMKIHQIPLDDDPNSIPAAVRSLVQTKYRFVFAVVFTQPTHDALLHEAFNQVSDRTDPTYYCFRCFYVSKSIF